VTADPAQGAELAFVTEDNYRRRGLASLVLRHFARIGREMGIVQFGADVLAENQEGASVHETGEYDAERDDDDARIAKPAVWRCCNAFSYSSRLRVGFSSVTAGGTYSASTSPGLLW
jgi:hypothetical protein